MTQEEKYKKALLEARAVLEPCLKYSRGKVREALDSIDKELKSFESEDERIRKFLIDLVSTMNWRANWPEDKVKEEKVKCLAWLEKRKENPKSADSIPSDCVSVAKCVDRDSNYGVFPEDVIVVARACEKLETHGYPELAYALKNVNLYTKEQKPVDYDHEMWKNCEANFEGGKKEVIEHPEKYGLQKPVSISCGHENDAEWSEADEKMRDRLITRLNWITYNTRTDGTSPNITFFDEIDWLKSLCPSWKPSEEQQSGSSALKAEGTNE